MKKETTMKYICAFFDKVYQCGYGDLQFIFHGTTVDYYNAGVYGWNCDVYADYSHDMAITTGYRNTRGKKIPRELIKKYSDKAQKITAKYNYSEWEKCSVALKRNREKFLDEVANI